MAHPKSGTLIAVAPQWKSAISTIAAVILSILFIVAGVWKITDPFSAAGRMAQAQVPSALSLPAALAFGIAETFAGVLLLVPRFRRWGAWLAGLMLIAFLIYVGAFYNVLRGEECNCFPFIKRAVGPAFFIGDVIMLALAGVAGAWARPSSGRRSAILILAAVAVFAGASYGINAVRNAFSDVPATILVEGKPVSLQDGRIFLYFFDPECSHCDAAARHMAKWNWKDTKIIGVVTMRAQFAGQFMDETGLRAPVSSDVEKLRKSFSFLDAPYGVALEDGRKKATFSDFDDHEPAAGLRRIGFIE